MRVQKREDSDGSVRPNGRPLNGRDRRVDAGSVGAGRSCLFEIGLAAAVDMNRCIMCADGEFAFAPGRNGRHTLARDSAGL
jgi:hypothetical protein